MSCQDWSGGLILLEVGLALGVGVGAALAGAYRASEVAYWRRRARRWQEIVRHWQRVLRDLARPAP